MTHTASTRLRAGVALAAIVAQLGLCAGTARAFCGFYVAKADAKLFNKSSKVVLARAGDETAITMASDYEGEPNEFALVVPVPTFIKKEQISVARPSSIISTRTPHRAWWNISTPIHAGSHRRVR